MIIYNELCCESFFPSSADSNSIISFIEYWQSKKKGQPHSIHKVKFNGFSVDLNENGKVGCLLGCHTHFLFVSSTSSSSSSHRVTLTRIQLLMNGFSRLKMFSISKEVFEKWCKNIVWNIEVWHTVGWVHTCTSTAFSGEMSNGNVIYTFHIKWLQILISSQIHRKTKLKTPGWQTFIPPWERKKKSLVWMFDANTNMCLWIK